MVGKIYLLNYIKIVISTDTHSKKISNSFTYLIVPLLGDHPHKLETTKIQKIRKREGRRREGTRSFAESSIPLKPRSIQFLQNSNQLVSSYTFLNCCNYLWEL